MNLVTQNWIPVQRKDGARERIAPWQLTENHQDNPIVFLDAPRADFNGALIQFLIGLIQTAAPPKNEDNWEEYFRNPPTPEILKQAFAPLAPFFNLAGDGPRFMQDFDLQDSEKKNIAALLIETPGDNTLRNNTDHFIKRGGVNGMCPACCATALFALQTNAPAGGAGHRTSLRGGGPLTTLVVSDDSLWHTIWLNVLEEFTFLNIYGSPKNNEAADRFPWLAPTRTSGKDGVTTTPVDVHPAQMYWATPRRIRLDLMNVIAGSCDICGEAAGHLIQHYHTQNYGVNYKGAWSHPLTPHIRDKDGMPLPRHAQPGGVPYRHWLGLVQTETKENREPARVVFEFHKRLISEELPFRLWAFGYDMDNMKARCWYEGTMPLIHLSGDAGKKLEIEIANIILAAREVAGNVRSCLKKAWAKDPGSIKGDIGFIDAQFWQATENHFYLALKQLHKASKMDSEETLTIRRQWHKAICDSALIIFDMHANSGPIEHGNPKRIVLARRDLGLWNHGKKVRELLGFAPPPAKRKTKQTISTGASP